MCGWIIRCMAGVMVAGMCLGGCSAYRPAAVNPADYPGVHREFDVTIGWRITPVSGRTAVEGYVRNTRYYIMQDLELWITLLDASGGEKARESFFVIPLQLKQDEAARFSVLLGKIAAPGEKLRFLYRYKGIDDAEQGLGWMNSFEAPVK